jgi:hypothetical protein
MCQIKEHQKILSI